MTKQKLLELCIKLRHREITKTDILKLKVMNDEEVDLVLSSNNKYALMKLLSNENFRKLSSETKTKIIDIVNNCDDQYGKVEHIINVATNSNAISSNLVVELVTIVSHSKGINQSYISSVVACNFDYVISKEGLEIVKILSACLYEEQLQVAYHAAINHQIIRSGNAAKIVKSICEAKNKQEALDIYYKRVKEVIEINPLDTLSDGKINGIDFWQVFSEEGEAALYLLDNIQEEEHLPSAMMITSENQSSRKRK